MTVSVCLYVRYVFLYTFFWFFLRHISLDILRCVCVHFYAFLCITVRYNANMLHTIAQLWNAEKLRTGVHVKHWKTFVVYVSLQSPVGETQVTAHSVNILTNGASLQIVLCFKPARQHSQVLDLQADFSDYLVCNVNYVTISR